MGRGRLADGMEGGGKKWLGMDRVKKSMREWNGERATLVNIPPMIRNSFSVRGKCGISVLVCGDRRGIKCNGTAFDVAFSRRAKALCSLFLKPYSSI